MQRWNPAPVELIQQAARQRWTRDNPAPDVLGFLVAFHGLDNGDPWSVRNLATWAGWTKHKAAAVLSDVRSFAAEWKSSAGQSPDSRRTPNGHSGREIPHTYEAKPDTGRTVAGQSPDRNAVLARARINTTHYTLDIEQSNVGLSDAKPDAIESEGEHEADPRLSIPDATTVDGRPAPVCRPEPIPAKAGRPPKPKAPRVDLTGLWDRMEDLRLQNTPNGHRAKLGKRREELRRRVAEHGAEAIEKAWRWVWEADHDRARFLRDNGYGIGTFLRAGKCRSYVEFAAQWDPDAAPAAAEYWPSDQDFDENGNLITH